MLHSTCYTLRVTLYLLHFTCHTLRVTLYVSHFTCYPLVVTVNVSHWKCHTSLVIIYLLHCDTWYLHHCSVNLILFYRYLCTRCWWLNQDLPPWVAGCAVLWIEKSGDFYNYVFKGVNVSTTSDTWNVTNCKMRQNVTSVMRQDVNLSVMWQSVSHDMWQSVTRYKVCHVTYHVTLLCTLRLSNSQPTHVNHNSKQSYTAPAACSPPPTNCNSFTCSRLWSRPVSVYSALLCSVECNGLWFTLGTPFLDLKVTNF